MTVPMDPTPVSQAFVTHMPNPLPLSGVVITKNEADRIGRCLASMQSICNELLVLDSGSTDDTVAVAQSFGARVEHQDWLGYAGQKNEAMARARNEWMLLLDADEWLAEGAAERIRALFESGKLEEADGWVLTRRNWFLGRRLRGSEPSERLIRRGWHYIAQLVHEYPDLSGKRLAPLDGEIEHDTARSLEDHLRKNVRYAQLWARQRHADGKRCHRFDGPLHAAAYLLKSYLLRAAWKDGREGWHYHHAHMRYVLDKYRFLHALGRTGRLPGEA